MNATGLPIPSVPATPATPATPGVDAMPSSVATQGTQPPTDFMLALAQMLSGNISSTTDGAVTTTLEDADTDATDDADALALLPLPLGQLQAPLPPIQGQPANADPLEMLGLTPRPQSAAARDAAILQALTDRLAAVETTEPTEPPTYLPSIDPQQPVRATSDGAITRPVHVPVGTPAWADEIGSRLTMMTEKGQHTASLRLSPENLGPLEIRIAMRDDQASVWFGAAHADTRAAIEHALPRLRELFAAQGMSLADAGVFREPPKNHVPFANAQGSQGEARDASDPVSTAVQVKVGLLDAYA